MTAYNREKYIAEAIESVLGSSYTNFELIIVDDGSTDNTVAIARSFEAKDKRIKVFINDKNLGDYPNRNKAAGYANGKYLKYVDSDDKLFPEGLQYCVQNMENFENADWAIIYPDTIPNEFVLISKEALEWHFFKRPFLKSGPGGTIIKRDFFNNDQQMITKRRFNGYVYKNHVFLDNPGIQNIERDVWEEWKKKNLI